MNKDNLIYKAVVDRYVEGNLIGRAITPHPDVLACVISCAYSFVCCANDIAENAVVDAIAALREAGMYRQNIKMLCRRVTASFTDYHKSKERAMFSENRLKLWMELADKYCDELQPHVEKLYFQVWQSLLNAGHEGQRAQVMARVLTASALMNLATQNYDNYFTANARQTGADLRCLFRGGDLTPIANLWRQVADIVFKGNAGATELNDPSVLAVQVRRRQLASLERMARLTDEVVDEHPEVRERIERENEEGRLAHTLK